ncbi:hypothetical protein Y032_0015g2682 [Ancylostoma ceylanicum]|uniref:Uncharacterized protein n=1 Tax=Ancylostoma ceylanicum TaxID=53326 RepID=A0A016V931_9BILA|nr:hypothetical protein Y032_0015g2682 [Ancylostoma ceylanicum]
MEELALDRNLRKQAGDMNAQAGKLLYVVRDFDIVKLRTPRDLPKRPLAAVTANGASPGVRTAISEGRRSKFPSSLLQPPSSASLDQQCVNSRGRIHETSCPGNLTGTQWELDFPSRKFPQVPGAKRYPRTHGNFREPNHAIWLAHFA